MKIKSMPIGLKLKIGFAAIITLLGVVFILVFIELKVEKGIVDKIFLHPYVVSNASKDIHLNMLDSYMLVDFMVIGRNTLSKDEIIAKINKDNSKIQEDFKYIFQQYLGPKEDIEKMYLLYKQHKILLMKILNENNTRTKELIFRKIEEQHNILDKELENLTKFENNKVNEFYHNSKVREKRMTYVITMAIIFAILLSILIATIIIKSIINPINALTKITDSINDGNLALSELKDTSMPVSRQDEIGALHNSYIKLMKQLLSPYKVTIYSEGTIIEKTEELRRLLQAFDKYVIATKTDHEGKITYASQAFQDISGYTREELVGKTHHILNSANMPKEFFSNLWETIQSGKVWSGEIKNKKKDGSFFWVKTYISPDFDKQQKVIAYNAISENITIAKAYKELLNTLEIRISKEVQKNKKQTDHMLQQSRLAQMGEMISMIAHQWRQPLASMSAITSTLSLDIMMDNYNKTYFQERLESINELSQHLSGTIDDFRSFFKNDKKEEEASIYKVVNECLNIIGPILKNKNIELTIDVDKEIVINTYINELKQVILNILKNAEDILLEQKTENAKISLKSYKEGSSAYITIEDNAGGIPSEIMDKIFDPYFSTKKQKEGTGLGLYMSKTIIKDHCRGALMATNTQFGAKFIIEIKNKEII